MMVVEYGEDIIIIDSGLMFPDDEMFGVDLVIPDTSYLNDKKQRIRGIFISHGHEDHIGGLPYVLPMLDFPPIYATRLNQGLISVKLKEHKLLDRTVINVVTPGDQVALGECLVEIVRVNHSVPDAVALAIHTPIGTIVHTADYKFDHTPTDGRPPDFATLPRIAHHGLLILLATITRS